MLHFSLLGFPVQIHWLFWLTSILLGGGMYASTPEEWIRALIWTAVVFVSVIVHELGHALVARRFGGRPAIFLHGLGGLTVMPGLRVNRFQSIQVSLAGPVAGILLGLLVIFLSSLFPEDLPWLHVVISYLIFVNIFWSFFNLLPILPMDGGQILRDVLGPSRLATARLVGAIMAGVLAFCSLWVNQWFLAIFMGFLAYSNFKNTPMQGGVIK